MIEQCIFCKIIAGEIPTQKVYEDDKVVAFLDLKPKAKGHTLIVHKTHTPDFMSTLSTNRGEAAGQTVFHLHIHIIPRYEKDGLKPWTHQEIEPKTRAELAEQIKKHL